MFSSLDDVRVLDFSQFLAGPTCTLLLSELGASVIKVERPGSGDPYRAAGPPFIDGEGVPFLSVNRNKRSLTLALDHPDGREVVRRLIGLADVVVHSFRPPAASKLGIAYEDVRDIRADVVYCSVSGYGLEGPRADKGGLDLIVQAASGLMSVTGGPDQEPVRMGVPITDYGTGMYAALAVVAAVRDRDRTGEGALIDSSLFATAATWSAIPYLHYQFTGENQPRTGNVHPHIAPYQVLRTRDGRIAISAPTQRSWTLLCRALGMGEAADDDRFATNERRTHNREALTKVLEERFTHKSTEEWTEILDGVDIPCGPVHEYDELLAKEQWMRHAPLADDEARGARFRVPVMPIRRDGQLTPVRSSSPALGEHTADVLAEAGYSQDEVARLRQRGVV